MSRLDQCYAAPCPSRGCSSQKVNNVVTLTSISSLKNALAVAERQVQRDQSQVQDDSARLNQSQAQLGQDQGTLGKVQERGQSAAQASATAALPECPVGDTAASQLPAASAPPAPRAPRAQLNTQGQTIGKLINVTA